MTATARGRFPPSIKFLAWNEAAERFSYYGMTSILVLHMVRNLGFPENQAVAAYQVFTAGVYFMPVLGALLADRLWGRYPTILWLSLGYVAGHGVLAVWESPWGLLTGLSLIALGAGGIKPNASAFAGDQIPPEDEGLLARLYDVQAGSVRLDGHDVREYDLQTLRRNFSIVLQDVPTYVIANGNSAQPHGGLKPCCISGKTMPAGVTPLRRLLPPSIRVANGKRFMLPTGNF